jgi:hypothetical protein
VNPFLTARTPEQLLGQLAGAASLCWDPRPDGVFDADQAAAFVDAAVARLKEMQP